MSLLLTPTSAPGVLLASGTIWTTCLDGRILAFVLLGFSYLFLCGAFVSSALALSRDDSGRAGYIFMGWLTVFFSG